MAVAVIRGIDSVQASGVWPDLLWKVNVSVTYMLRDGNGAMFTVTFETLTGGDWRLLIHDAVKAFIEDPTRAGQYSEVLDGVVFPDFTTA